MKIDTLVDRIGYFRNKANLSARELSLRIGNELRGKWHTMFKAGDGHKYGIRFTNFLKAIGLKFEDTCLHSLRHTFCSNLFYLGAPDKYRQHAMGHKDSRMTSDRYTTYDPNVTKQDIIKIYGDRYPTFDNNAAALLAS